MTDRYAESDTWPNPATSTEPARPATVSDADGSRVVGEGSGAQKAREARYAEAVRDVQIANGGRIRYTELIARAVMAVADAEQAEMKAEVERLTRWKSEATEVILGLQDLGRALELPLGERITGEAAAEAARTLKAEVERLRAELTSGHESHQWWRRQAYEETARREAAESALTEAREQLSRLRELRGVAEDRVSDLAEELSRFRADVEALADDWDLYDEPCGETLRAILAEPAEATASRPPETSGAGSVAPVAAEEGGEQEAGEVPQQYATSHGFTPSVGNPFADPEQCKVMLARYVCPYSREEHDPALPPVDVDAFGYRRTPRPAPSGSDEQGNRPATPDANGVHDTTGGE